MSAFFTLVTMGGDQVFVNVDHIAYVTPWRDPNTEEVTGSTLRFFGNCPVLVTPHPVVEVVALIASALDERASLAEFRRAT